MAIKKTDPKSGILKGKGATVSRNSRGVLSSVQGSNYAGVSNSTMKSDRATAAGTGNGSYGSGVAPRVGGTAKKGPGKVVSYGKSSAINKKNLGKLKKK